MTTASETLPYDSDDRFAEAIASFEAGKGAPKNRIQTEYYWKT
jgi:hypothetical protein